MKKKILSILLCLCMVAVLLPTTALAATPVENVTFDYAYDAQREPAFPSAPGTTIRLSSLNYPIMSNSSRGNRNDGTWTLTRVGTYSYVTGNVDNNVINNVNVENLRYIVGEVAGAYRDISDTNTIVIHELKNGNTHIAYGVIIPTVQEDGYVLFLGDSLGGGAGYLLSQNKINYDSDTTVTMRAEMVATEFIEQTARIALEPDEDCTFPEATVGYDPVQPLEITVKNTGTEGTGLLNITLSGNNADCFTVTPGAIENIGADSIGASFQVKPNARLAVGTYTATVTVSNTNVVPQSIDVSFTVTASPSTPVVIIVPDDTADTTDPAKNPETGDNSTHLLWAVMASSALCAAALLFSSRRRGEEMQ